ncbi:MAG: VanW family protein [Eubacterium sp.]|nr:VanW family protein [Eubacterium sp.]
MGRMARKEEKKKNRKVRLKVGGGILAVLCIAYLISCMVVPPDTIVSGLSMNGTDLGGLTRKQAETELAKEYQKDYADRSLTVKALDQDYKIPMYASLTFNDAGAADKAFSYGHDTFLLRGFQMLKAMALGEKMHFYPSITNQPALDTELDNSGLSTLNTTVQTSYELTSDELQFTMGKTGYSVDLKGLKTAIGEAVDTDDYETVIEAPLIQGTVEPVNMEAVYNEVHKVKREATLKVKDKTYKIIKSVTGIDFDKESARQAVEAASEGDLVHVEIVKENPVITTKDLKKHLFEKAVGSCTTYVRGSYARVSNVQLAAKTINGIILLPGDEFSYNESVGQRTAERGYQKAPAYSDGKSVMELGGGVCQVSSTLYKAVVLSNLEILEHHNHTYESAYIGLGMDATVSWDGPDFRFKNNSTYPVKIVAEYSDGALTCKIRGAKLDDHEVQFVADILKTIPYTTKYKKDKTLAKGKTKVVESGHNGYVVQTYRIIVDSSGKQISKEKEDRCVYTKKDAVALKGTKEKKAKATTQQGNETKKTTEQSGSSTGKKKGQ